MNVIESLKWRYAVKKFDSQKKISQNQLNGILNAINLSPSSYGMQPYKVVVISDIKIRKKLRKKAFNQDQITEASHLILFASHTNLGKKYIEDVIDYMIKKRSLPYGSLNEFKINVTKTIKSLSPIERENWAIKQSYIALGTLLTYCALERIDACPMEGFLKESFDEILNLSNQNVSSSVLAAVGYRSLDDSFQRIKKIRKSLSNMVIYI